MSSNLKKLFSVGVNILPYGEPKIKTITTFIDCLYISRKTGSGESSTLFSKDKKVTPAADIYKCFFPRYKKKRFYGSLAPLPTIRNHPTILYHHGGWTLGLTYFPVCWALAGFDPWTAALHSGAPSLSPLSSQKGSCNTHFW